MNTTNISFDTFDIQKYQELGLKITDTGVNGCMMEVPNGCLGNDTGKNFQVYVPYNISDDTNTALTMFAPSSDAPGVLKGPATSIDALLNSECESLVVFVPDKKAIHWTSDEVAASCMRALDLSHDIFGGNNQNVSVHSGSDGGYQACYIAAENYEQNAGTYDSKITNVALFSSSNSDIMLEDKRIYKLDVLAKNGVSVFNYTSGYLKTGEDGAGREVKFAEAYAKMGGNVIIADTSVGSHDDKCLADYKDNYFDFIRGNGDIEHPEFVNFYKLEYNEKTGELERIPLTYEKMKQLTKDENHIIVSNDMKMSVDYSDLVNQYAYLKSLSLVPSDVLNNPNLTSDESFVVGHADGITKLVSSAAFLQGINNNNFSSTSDIPGLEDVCIKEFYSQTGQLLDIISNEIKNVLLAADIIKQTDQELSQNVEDQTIIEDATSVAGVSTGVGTVGNTTGSGANYNYGTQNNAPNDTTNNSTSSNGSNNSINSEIENDFPNYDELHTDATKTVYDCEDFKLIVHNDGEKVTGFEYYYNFGTKENAINNLSSIHDKYQTDLMVDKILQKDQYVKIIFKEDLFKDYTLSELKTKFADLTEITG